MTSSSGNSIYSLHDIGAITQTSMKLVLAYASMITYMLLIELKQAISELASKTKKNLEIET